MIFGLKVGNMSKTRVMSLISIVVILAFASIYPAKGQESTENLTTFFDSTVSGLSIQVNATEEVEPGANITVLLSLKGSADTYVDKFNMSLCGFVRGILKTVMASVAYDDLDLNDSQKEWNFTFKVPEDVWGTTSGEITLTCTTKIGGVELTLRDLTLGFTMTNVKNVYLESVEAQLQDLNGTYLQLNSTYWQLNQTYKELEQNYTALQGSRNELESTRQVMAILVIATVFFVATTVYLVIRKPKDYW
jgi:hypothetical protein